MKMHSHVCPICMSQFEISDNTQRSRIRIGFPIDICKKCAKKINIEKGIKTRQKQRAEQTAEQKALFRKHCSEAKQKYWDTAGQEARDRTSRNIKNWRASMSEEQKADISDKLSKSMKRRHESMSPDEKLLLKEHLLRIGAEYRDSLSPEELKREANKLVTSYLKKQPEAVQLEFLSKTSTDDINLLTDEDISIIWSIIRKRWWDNMSQDKYYKWQLNNSLSFAKKHANDNIIWTSELYFVNELNRMISAGSKLSFQQLYVSNKIDPRFSENFAVNPYTGSIHISPYHIWDFVIHINDQDILVDVDGSIHKPNWNNGYFYNKNGERINRSEYQVWKDSQRPYQTDGLPAYVIKAYENIINDSTMVLSLKSNQEIPFSAFKVHLDNAIFF